MALPPSFQPLLAFSLGCVRSVQGWVNSIYYHNDDDVSASLDHEEIE